MIELVGDGFRLRSADEGDVAPLVALAVRPEIADFLAAVSPWDEGAVRAALAGESDDVRLVLEVERDGRWVVAGGLGFAVDNRRSRIVSLHGVMIDPAYRGQGLGERACRLLALHLIRERGFHRVQLEVYGFNDRARRLFVRAGFVEEGIRRGAYRRHGAWADGVLFGLVAEDPGVAPE